MSKFVNLHTHSHYSLLDGLAKIDHLIDAAKAKGQTSLALTDHGVMYGAIEFYKKCHKAGIKPIIGCEVYIAPRKMTDKSAKIDANPYHLVLLAKNNQGYENLMEIVSLAHLKGYYYKPRIDKQALKKYSKGLIALSACLQGEVPRTAINQGQAKALEVAREYQDIFGKDNFYLELQPHFKIAEQKKVNKVLINLNKKYHIPLVVTKDIHYINKTDQRAHEVLLCIQTGRTIDDEDRMSMAMDEFYFPSEKEMLKAFPDQEQAIANTGKIADQCQVNLEFGNFYLPKIKMPKGETTAKYLKKVVYKGAKERYSGISKKIKERIDYELEIIDEMNYNAYFLIVADFVKFARGQKILVGPGRGSAGGSIVAYCLKITDLDPLKFNLLFERFLNPERISQPDIDLDFPDDRRDEVIKYVEQKYGVDSVAQIITFGKMEARASVRDVTRALGLGYDLGDRISKQIPFGMSLKEALKNSKELKAMYQGEDQAKEVLDMAQKLEGVVRHVSVHAAGVVIAPGKLTHYAPVQRAPRAEEAIITQYSMYDLEDIGLVKMDFLGLSNLTILGNALKIIKATTQKEIVLAKIPLDDKPAYKLLSNGQTTGVFQLASDGMKRYLKQLKPTRFEDIIAMVALYRPWPMESIPDFIAAKHGQKKVEYLHPKLEPILKSTYGVITYQEQVFEIARTLAGFSYGEADILRKAVGKKIKKLLDEQKDKVIAGIIKNGIDKKVAKKIWEFIEPFARYGFNKSHAAGYGLISYWTAYLKANYPSQFMAALMTSDKDDLDKLARDIQECKYLKAEVLPPDVNESFVDFGVAKETGDIRFGLSAIKNVGDKATEIIVEERKTNGKYKTIEDFAFRLAGNLNRKIVENLARAGAFKSLASRESVLSSIDDILAFSSKIAKDKANGQADLFEGMIQEKIALDMTNGDPIPDQTKLKWEKELLGIYISSHPLDQYKEKLKLLPYQINDLSKFKKQAGKNVLIVGIITSIKKIITRSNEPMLFVTMEDFSGTVELIVFPSILNQTSEIWSDNEIIIAQGKLSFKDKQGETIEPKLLLEKVKGINRAPELWARLRKKAKENNFNILQLKLSEKIDNQNLKQLKELFQNHQGKDKAELILPDGKNIITKDRIKISPALTKKIIKQFKNNIKYSIIDKTG